MIPLEVIYTTVGKTKKKARNVLCVIYPTALAQALNYTEYKPIKINAGDIEVDWAKTSPGYEYFIEKYYGH